MDAIRIGFIGAGGIFPTHAEALRAIPGVELAAVCDIDEDHAREQAERFGIPHVARDAAELVAHRGLTAVLVLTPPKLHAEHTLAALDAGLHVFCEKPLAADLDDGRRIVEAGRKSDRVMQVGFNNLFEPEYRTMWKMFHEGKLGRLVHAWDRHAQFRPTDSWENPKRRDPWRLDQEVSGGRMQEFGSHKVHWLTALGGPVSSLMGRSDMVASTLAKRGVDDTTLMMMDFERGGVGTVEVSLAPTAQPGRSVGIQGTEASVVWDGAANFTLLRRDAESSEKIEPHRDFETRHEHFVRCIREGKQSMEYHASAEFAFDVLDVCLTFLAAAAERGCARPGTRGSGTP